MVDWWHPDGAPDKDTGLTTAADHYVALAVA